MSNTKYCIIACIAAAQAAGVAAWAQTTYSYQITQDTYIDSGNSTLNYGTGSTLKVVDSTTPCNTLFELPASLFSSYSPSSIQSAIVSFYAFQTNGHLLAGYNNITLYPLTQAFVEGTGGKNGAAGAGATWLTYDGINSWASPGGDYDAQNSVADILASSVVYNGTNVFVQPGDAPNGAVFVTFNITPLLNNPTADAELQDNGALLTLGSGANPQSYVTFPSANTTGASDSAPYRPLLDVTVVPEPSSLLLVVLGTAATACLLKKRDTRH